MADIAHEIFSVNLEDEMRQSYMDYAMSVIVGRALPDVRDGLKPVHRRVLYAMRELGNDWNKPYKKSARVVGDVIGKYHPHGDSAVYDTIVRMAQPFSMRYMLVDGQGNFGSVDGDAPAAMRYTEVRMSRIAQELLADIEKRTVDFAANYDESESEPTVLPTRVPNLLVNGSSGIAVGMATNIPPHNLGETIDAVVLRIQRPDADLDDLMQVLPAPDFPTGGRIVAGPGIAEAYRTGKGAIVTEAVASTETRSGGLPRIVITEIPYQVNKATLLERIAELVNRRKLEAVRDLRDESSRDGMRIVIELKRGEQPAATLAALYDATDLRTTFHANFVALVPPTDARAGAQPEPRTLGLCAALDAYIAHQRDVLTRRSRHRRAQAAARAHVLEGLLIALDDIDAVIALIRQAASAEAARSELIARYDLSEEQASAILDMQLRRLARLEATRIAEEHVELLERIAALDVILGDPAALDRLLIEELRELQARFATPRRSRLARTAGTDGGDAPALPELAAQEVIVSVTAAGYVKAIPSRRTGAAHTHPQDPVVAVLRATTEDTLLLVDAAGGGYRVSLADVPVVTARQRGATVAQLLGDAPAAPLIGAVVLAEHSGDLLTAAASGLVKRTEASAYAGRTRTLTVAGVRPGDRLVAVACAVADDGLLLGQQDGLVLRTAVDDIRRSGRTASGVTGQLVPDGAALVSLTVLPAGTEQVLTVGAEGTVKVTALEEYPVQRRGGKGVQAGVDELCWCGPAVDLHLTADGVPRVVLPAEATPARRTARTPTLLGAISGPVAADLGPAARPHP